MAHVNPPYRCDVVGSFLRPKTIAQARVRFTCGQISKEELTAIEDAEIKKLIAKERENGLSAVTDGEFRRAYWHLDFLAALGGIRHVKAEAWSVHFEGHQPKAETIVIANKIHFPENHPFLEAYDRLKNLANDVPIKFTIPSPSMLHLICCVREENYQAIDLYKDKENELFSDIAQTWKDAMLSLYAKGCRYLQFDDTSWGEFCSQEKRSAYAARGIDVDTIGRKYVACINEILEAKPEDMTVTMHICRGNFRRRL